MAGITGVGAGGSRIVNDIQLPQAVQGLGEVASPLLGSRDRVQNLLRTALPRAFVIEEEKRLILSVV